MSKKFKAYLVGNRVLVFDDDVAKELFKLGFYGKPLGIPKVKGEEVKAPLELDLIEALYLMDKGFLEVYDGEKRLSRDEFVKRAEELIPKFKALYIVYRELRDAGYVVRSGLKYGTDFALYIHGPGIDHAPYLVSVVERGEKIDPLEIVKAGRLSHSVRKRFIIALVNPEVNKAVYLVFSWARI